MLLWVLLSFPRVEPPAGEKAVDSARPYRKVFASYSHKDRPIVEQVVKANGGSPTLAFY